MIALASWRRGPILTLSLAWAVSSFCALTLYLRAWANSFAAALTDAALRMGATSAHFHIDVFELTPGLIAQYLVVMLGPPAILIGLWQYSRRRVESSERAPIAS